MRSGDDLNAAGRQGRDMLRYAAEQNSGQPTAASLSKHDQVHCFAFSDLQDKRSRITQTRNRLNCGYADTLGLLLGAQQNFA